MNLCLARQNGRGNASVFQMSVKSLFVQVERERKNVLLESLGTKEISALGRTMTFLSPSLLRSLLIFSDVDDNT